MVLDLMQSLAIIALGLAHFRHLRLWHPNRQQKPQREWKPGICPDCIHPYTWHKITGCEGNVNVLDPLVGPSIEACRCTQLGYEMRMTGNPTVS